jgi:hypothetical protein
MAKKKKKYKKKYQDGGLGGFPYYEENPADHLLSDIQQVVEPEPIQSTMPSPQIKSIHQVSDTLTEPEDKSGYTMTEREVEKDLGVPGTKQLLAQARKPQTVGATPEEGINIQNEYKKLLDEYKQAGIERNKAKKLQALLGLTKAVAQFGAQYATGQAAAAGGIPLRAPDVTINVPELAELQQGPDLQAS